MSILLGFSLKGVTEHEKKMKARKDKAEKERKKAIKRVALAIAADAVRSIQRGPKTGREYGKHRASSPGEPPASDTGNLARSVTVSDLTGEGEAVISVRAPYAAALEFGTDDGKILERPFLRPAVERHKDELIEALKEAISGD
jgi:HK97 gp10 family phage protein